LESYVNIKSTVFAVVAFVGSVVGASAVEEAPHQVLLRDGDFEIRQYPALIVAETTVHADRNSAASAGFRWLAGYIFGGNAKKQSIAMTAPVIEARPEGMSAAGESGEWVIRFVMPQGFSLANLPKPDAEKIVLREEQAARWAVLKFSGLASDDSVAKKTIELAAAMKARNLAPDGYPIIAQYDPPWTLPFLRRNEIMIPIHTE
jgi:SOUL heme-binding protein